MKYLTLAVAIAVSLILVPSASATQARLADRHTAVAPANAPLSVKKMVQAANRISRKPYLWGGGHGSFNSRGYDCSGAVSFVLRAGGYLRSPMTSGSLAGWGKRGKNRWVTVYANSGHAFMIIAGLRFDTGYITDGDRSGPGWSKQSRPMSGYAVRSPRGLTNKVKPYQSNSGGIGI